MSEEVIARVDRARLYLRETPFGWPKGGQLVLTNKRLVFINGIYGPVDIEWGLRIKDSFAIALEDIVEAKAEKNFLKLHFRMPSGDEKTYSFVFLTFTLKEAALLGYFAGLSGILMGKAFGVPSLSKSPYEQMANAIESLKKARESSTQK